MTIAGVADFVEVALGMRVDGATAGQDLTSDALSDLYRFARCECSKRPCKSVFVER